MGSLSVHHGLFLWDGGSLLYVFCVLVFSCASEVLEGSLVLVRIRNPCGNVRLVCWLDFLSFCGVSWSFWPLHMLGNGIVGVSCLFVAFLLCIVLLPAVSSDQCVPFVDATFLW